MRRLSSMDVAFLLMERRHQPLHVGALALFKPPEGAPPDFGAQLAARLGESQIAAKPFNHRPLSRLGMFYWEEDQHFDLAHHFVHMSLPKPGRIRELLSMISRVHSAHLDRAYPLWRYYLIEGLEDGRIASYMKIHHSVVDGISGIRLMMNSFSTDRDISATMPPTWEVGELGQRDYVISKALASLDKLRAGAASVPAVARHLRQSFMDARNKHPDLVTSVRAPRCILNSPITASRRFSAQSYDMPRLRGIAEKMGGTTNDVVLAMCAGGLRLYLQDLNALPDEPLIAGVPVSLHRDRENAKPGNAVTVLLANLATNEADPLERFRKIKASVDYSKNRFQTMEASEMVAYAAGMLAPGAINVLGGREHIPMNVVISHVPGPRAPIYWQGCELEGLYPVSLIIDGVALNMTMVSRHDRIDFGIIACRRTLPSVQRLLDHVETALSELEAALG